MKFTKSIKWLPIALLAIFFLSSCTAGNQKFDIDPAGFWMGMWHGAITVVSFIISLFNDSVTIYESNNTGWPYNLGYVLGILIIFGGGSKGTCRRK